MIHNALLLILFLILNFPASARASHMLTATCKNFQGYLGLLEKDKEPIQAVNPDLIKNTIITVSIDLDTGDGTFLLKSSPDKEGISGIFNLPSSEYRNEKLITTFGVLNNEAILVGLSRNPDMLMLSSLSLLPESFSDSANAKEQLRAVQTIHGDCVF